MIATIFELGLGLAISLLIRQAIGDIAPNYMTIGSIILALLYIWYADYVTFRK